MIIFSIDYIQSCKGQIWWDVSFLFSECHSRSLETLWHVLIGTEVMSCLQGSVLSKALIQRGQRSGPHPRAVSRCLWVKVDDDTMRVCTMTSPAGKWERALCSLKGRGRAGFISLFFLGEMPAEGGETGEAGAVDSWFGHLLTNKNSLIYWAGGQMF